MIAIVGGGIIGLSIAWRLARQGLEVTVMNAASRGGEASPAGAGMLAPGGELFGKSVWMELGSASYALYGSFVEELSAEAGRAIDYRICGAVEVARSEQEWRELRERGRRQAMSGILSTETAEGIYYPQDGYVDPKETLAALRTACERRGVKMEERRLVTDIGADRFAALVVAAGAWSGEIAVFARGERLALPRTLPVKGHLLGYWLRPGSLEHIRRHGHTYLLQRGNGFTIAGSTEERVGFDAHVDPEVCADIASRAAELWPQLAGRAPAERWIGFRPATEDLLPKIGRFEDTNVWLAYGHYRNGILLAPVTAERVAGSIISSLATSSLGKG